jgi:hypothetical protein
LADVANAAQQLSQANHRASQNIKEHHKTSQGKLPPLVVNPFCAEKQSTNAATT